MLHQDPKRLARKAKKTKKKAKKFCFDDEADNHDGDEDEFRAPHFAGARGDRTGIRGGGGGDEECDFSQDGLAVIVRYLGGTGRDDPLNKTAVDEKVLTVVTTKGN